ncbi:hypothetical protein Pelo_1384 [Pelomyxa schiedti]|nr:hypothetical protein Pelo_1384 [Pelomyxa schiedti]
MFSCMKLHACIIMYSIGDRREGFDTISTWSRTVRSINPLVRLIVCGNKADLSKRGVTREEGQHIAQSIGADVWIETSAKTGHNIDKLFFLAALHALQSAHDSLLIPQNNNPAPTPINSNFRVDVSIIHTYSLWQFHFIMDTAPTTTHPRDVEGQQQQRAALIVSRRHVVMVSRVLWEQVVVPWVLAPARGAQPWGEALPEAVAGCVFRVAEAAFPLVALCSRAVAETNAAACASRWAEWGRCSAVEAAAAAPSPRCVSWILSHAASSASSLPWPPGGRSTICDGGEEEEGEEGEGETGRRGVRERRKAREQIAVVVGLCRGGHLDWADWFVENNWDVARWVTSARRSTDTSSAVVTRTSSGAVSVIPAPANVLTEFWSERGISRIMRSAAAAGNLDVIKWVLSRLLHINEGNKMILKEYMHCAAYGGHVHILKWLVDTFDLMELSRTMYIGSSFRVRNKASELRDCVESFPHWTYSGCSKPMAYTTASCKGSPANEIIEVCQWFKDKLSLGGADFVGGDELPKHVEVIKWALSDVTDPSVLQDTWNDSCYQLGNVELGEWFIEKKGMIPTVRDFTDACFGRHDNLVFVEWLSKKIPSLQVLDLLDSLRNALSSRNELISRWLEKRIISTTNSRPGVSLSSLCAWSNVTIELTGWLKWLLTHSDQCDIDCSTSEVACAVRQCAASMSPIKFSIAIAVWKHFSLCPVTHHDILVDLLGHIVKRGTFHQFKEAVSLGEITPVEEEQLLTQCGNSLAPSCKAVKWLCSRLLQRSSRSDEPTLAIQVLPSILAIFVDMISRNKRGSAEWLFNKFSITLRDFVVASEKRSTPLGTNVDLATWKHMLKLFPDLGKGDALHHFIGVLSASPLHAQFTMHALGVTLAEIQQLGENGHLPPTTKWWADHQA